MLVPVQRVKQFGFDFRQKMINALNDRQKQVLLHFDTLTKTNFIQYLMGKASARVVVLSLDLYAEGMFIEDNQGRSYPIQYSFMAKQLKKMTHDNHQLRTAELMIILCKNPAFSKNLAQFLFQNGQSQLQHIIIMDFNFKHHQIDLKLQYCFENFTVKFLSIFLQHIMDAQTIS